VYFHTAPLFLLTCNKYNSSALYIWFFIGYWIKGAYFHTPPFFAESVRFELTGLLRPTVFKTVAIIQTLPAFHCGEQVNRTLAAFYTGRFSKPLQQTSSCLFSDLVGADGIEPPIHADYMIYSHAPTCRAILPSANDQHRTGTDITVHRILSPACLPIPPHWLGCESLPSESFFQPHCSP
jgi:hypothetical protein